MKGAKKILKNASDEVVRGFLTAANAFSKMQEENGIPSPRMSAANAKDIFKKLVIRSTQLVNRQSPKHNEAYKEFSSQLRGKSEEAFNSVEDMGRQYLESALNLAQEYSKIGMGAEASMDAAFNSIAGNPVLDHFANLQVFAAQLYQDTTLVNCWLESGDAFALPTEPGGTGTDKSRFRAPTEQVVGSAKIYQGDINPRGHFLDDENRLQINLNNEFKDAVTLGHLFTIDQDMRNQALGYQEAVSPALAGFILQNRYFTGAQTHVMKLAELMFAFGSNPAGNYTPGVGGSYGLLSPSIQLQLADWNAANPTTASASDWAANTSKLIQKIQNYYALPVDTTAQLDTAIDPSLYYKDIVRLLNMAAQQNVDFKAREWAIFVPTPFYGSLVQYPGTMTASGQGTFNKNLSEMISTATGGKIINKVTLYPSNLMNYAATNNNGTTNGYNYMVAVAMGAEQERKPVIMPGQTAAPYITSTQVNAQLMEFRVQYPFGGPMFMQFGGAYVLEFSNQYP